MLVVKRKKRVLVMVGLLLCMMAESTCMFPQENESGFAGRSFGNLAFKGTTLRNQFSDPSQSWPALHLGA